jgi:hypothetical protein
MTTSDQKSTVCHGPIRRVNVKLERVVSTRTRCGIEPLSTPCGRRHPFHVSAPQPLLCATRFVRVDDVVTDPLSRTLTQR